ncbi:MAG: hypothetical protein KatS3mg102_2157 [Planctomycetota bacterium]|nr:MAG: hypothetical protein KatS3mg102_2157 [Planctomycetota bacterium]
MSGVRLQGSCAVRWAVASALGLLLLGSLGAAPAGAAPRDRLVFIDGEEREVAGIIEEKVDEVRVRGGNPVPAQQLLTIVRAEVPPAYAQAEAAMRAGRYPVAIERFQAALADPNAPAWVGPWASAGLAEALTRQAEGGEQAAAGRAVDAWRRLMEAHPGHFLEPRALEGLGRALLAAGRAAEALETFGRLADRRYGEYWELKGKVGRGLALMANRQFVEALTEFEASSAAAARRPGLAEVYAAAQAGKGRTYMAKGDYDGAIRFYEEMAKRGEATSAQAAADAFVNLARAYEQRGGEDDKRQALRVYMEVALFYAGAPAAYAEALLRAGRLLEERGERERAAAYFRELKARCPDSPQARQVP